MAKPGKKIGSPYVVPIDPDVKARAIALAIRTTCTTAAKSLGLDGDNVARWVREAKSGKHAETLAPYLVAALPYHEAYQARLQEHADATIEFSSALRELSLALITRMCTDTSMSREDRLTYTRVLREIARTEKSFVGSSTFLVTKSDAHMMLLDMMSGKPLPEGVTAQIKLLGGKKCEDSDE